MYLEVPLLMVGFLLHALAPASNHRSRVSVPMIFGLASLTGVIRVF